MIPEMLNKARDGTRRCCGGVPSLPEHTALLLLLGDDARTCDPSQTTRVAAWQYDQRRPLFLNSPPPPPPSPEYLCGGRERLRRSA